MEALGELVPVGRPGGQGRVYRPAAVPAAPAAAPPVVKIYRRRPGPAAVQTLADMVAWSRSLESREHARLHAMCAWPLALVTRGRAPVGIAMQDLSARFEAPFVMPSGRRAHVLLSLEHLLGGDDYLRLRGLGVRLDTATRGLVAERISGALAFLHRHAIVASDIAPNNLLVAFGRDGPEVCFIDCDSMVFRGRQALPAVETADWQIPSGFSEPPRTRAADAYKLGLIVLRLFARSHDARSLAPHARQVPAELHPLLSRALGAEPANRPPAGEWQRALRELVAHNALNERYPGPAPTPIRGVPRRPEARPPAPPVRSTAAHPAAARSRGTNHPLSLAWLAAAAVIFVFVLARLFAATAQPTGDANFGAGGSGATGNGPQYYDAPAPPGFGR